jgi:hypothetical protein
MIKIGIYHNPILIEKMLINQKQVSSMGKIVNFLLLIVIFVCLSSLSFAYDTYVNINITETVYQNITFGENFILNESITTCNIQGLINVSNPSSKTVSDISINFSKTDRMYTNFTLITGRNGTQQGDRTPGVVWTLHIPELRTNESTLWQYNLSCSSVPTPLNITTNYQTNVGDVQTKVLAGKNFTVIKRASNDVVYGDLSNVRITVEALGVTWNTTVFNFTFINISESGDWYNVNTTNGPGDAFNDRRWYWNVNGSSINMGDAYTITYYVKSPDNVPTSDTYKFLLETLQYEILGLASNLTVDSVIAISDLIINEQKQIIRPADNISSNNVTWQIDANLSTPIEILYNITKVSMWVTKNLSPVALDTDFGRLNNTLVPANMVNDTTPYIPGSWIFNYTDGSSNQARPPIVWIKPYFHIFAGQNQILTYNLTRNGTDLYLSYIYVVNGYWLQVDKNITNAGPDRYKIDIFVENIGNAWTPQDLAVTVYDFIPSEFNWTHSDSFIVAPGMTEFVDGGDFNGTALRWQIPPKAPYNSSLAPKNGPDAVPTLSYWNNTYYVNGTGEYKVSELYIVGLDPMKVDGAGSHEGITVISNLASHTKEVFYAVGVLALIVLNIVNFVMTRNINQKLKDSEK